MCAFARDMFSTTETKEKKKPTDKSDYNRTQKPNAKHMLGNVEKRLWAKPKKRTVKTLTTQIAGYWCMCVREHTQVDNVSPIMYLGPSGSAVAPLSAADGPGLETDALFTCPLDSFAVALDKLRSKSAPHLR